MSETYRLLNPGEVIEDGDEAFIMSREVWGPVSRPGMEVQKWWAPVRRVMSQPEAAARIRTLEAEAREQAQRIEALTAELARVVGLASAVRIALETVKDYVSDAADGHLQYKGKSGIQQMAAEDMTAINAALAAWEARNG